MQETCLFFARLDSQAIASNLKVIASNLRAMASNSCTSFCACQKTRHGLSLLTHVIPVCTPLPCALRSLLAAPRRWCVVLEILPDSTLMSAGPVCGTLHCNAFLRLQRTCVVKFSIPGVRSNSLSQRTQLWFVRRISLRLPFTCQRLGVHAGSAAASRLATSQHLFDCSTIRCPH